jgi:surface protein
MNDMFRYCSYLSKINLSSFNSDNVKNLEDIFFSVPTTCKIICDDIRIRNMYPRANCLGCSIF